MLYRQRSTSTSALGYKTIQNSRQAKNMRRTYCSINKLKTFKASYDQPYRSVKVEQGSPEDDLDEELKAVHLFKDDFQSKSHKLCEDLCFNLSVFEKLYSESNRKKGLIVKLYGWDKQFQECFFLKNQEEIRSDITPESLYNKLGLSARTFTARNRYNKLRLFLNELINNNKKQQDLQSKFMKLRMENQLSKIDHEMIKMMKKNDRADLRGFLSDIGSTQDMMINAKVRAHNKEDDLIRLEQ